jgi:DMSO/TMAO reductase YedYZ molybdopterin-dependent catalytic subunit
VRALVVAALIAPIALASPAACDDGLVVVRSTEQMRTIDRATIEQLPTVELHVSFATSHGPEQAHYTGALLWTLLQRTEALAVEPRERLHHVVAVTGHDGYVAVLALAEIDPEFAGKQVLLAYRRDGQPLPDHELRLVVPGDRRGGRSVRDVVRIELH